MLIENATKPFIYIKNIGTSNLTLIGSSLNLQETSSYYEKKFDDIFTGAACNYLICPNESLFLSLKSSTDGSAYYSIVEYPFGFYYDIDNVSSIAKSGGGAICCGKDGHLTYTYEQIFNFDDSFSICETNPNEQIYSTQYFVSGNFDLLCYPPLCRTDSHPQTTGKWSLYLSDEAFDVFPNFLISGERSNWPSIYECPYYSGNIFSIHAESGKNRNSIICGSIKPEKFPESGNYASIFTIKNKNKDQDYYVDFSCSGKFQHLDLDLLRIDHEGYVHVGTSTNFYEQCEIINGFYFSGNSNLETGSANGLNYNNGFHLSFLIETYTDPSLGASEVIFHEIQDGVSFLITSANGIIHYCAHNFEAFDDFCGPTIETGKLTCIFICGDGGHIKIAKADPCCLNFYKYNTIEDIIALPNGNCFLEICQFTPAVNITGSYSYFSLGRFATPSCPSVGNFLCAKLIDFYIETFYNTGYYICFHEINCLDFGIPRENIPVYNEYIRRTPPNPLFRTVKSQCPLILNQWNDYLICIRNCNYVYNTQNNFSVYIEGSSIGCCGYFWSCTGLPNERFVPYEIPNNISGLTIDNGIDICDIYYLTISSLNNDKSEFFCGGLSDIVYISEFRQDNNNLIYDDYLCIDFDFKCKNFIGKKHSLYFNYLIDDCANLTLSASGKVKAIRTENKICSLYGGNFHEGIVKVCELELYNESGLLTKIKLDENYTGDNFFQSSISGDCSLCLYYNIDNFIQNKCYRYLYCSATPIFSSKQCFVCNFFGINNILCINNECEISGNLLYELTGNFDSCIFVDLNLQNDFSLNTVSGLIWKKSSMFLPPINCLPYCYCFQISNVNNLPNASNGNWTQNQTGLIVDEYINYTEIVSINDQNYINCCSKVYDFVLDVSESRSKISDIQCKNEDSIGEPFIAVFDINEETFFYSGLEYRYNPVCSVIFRDVEYSIPNICMNMQVFSSGNSVSFDFPIRALNQDKIKIIAESQTIELVSRAGIDLDYSGFQMKFSCYSSNCNAFKIPKISSGCISPNLCAEIYPCSKVENCINFYIDPYSNFKDDLTYGMNNFLFFIASQLNSGLVYCCNFSGFDYGTSDYNFLMVDLKNEFYDCGYSVPSGSEKFLINSIISFEDLNFEQPLLYKSISGNGYNYIVPVPTGLVFSDCTNSSVYGIICNEYSINATLKDITTGFQYTGGSTGYFYTGSGALTDEILSGFFSGDPSGFYSGFLFNSCFCYLNNSYFLNINNQEINQTESGKLICFNKAYAFSGVQPVILTSNYPLQEIKNNLVLSNLSNYCSSRFDCSGVFYYTYDITKNKKENLKFLSPDFTFIQYINWTDDRGNCNYLCFLCSDNAFGQIQKNAASIKFEVTGIVQNNRYLYSLEEAESICFIIREDL
jgi:hypothetical protein